MLILPFTASAATLDTAGGKGANLARLARAGFPVPQGFIIATAAYQAFVAANALEPVIQVALANASADDAGALDQASAAIRAAFSAGALPPDLQAGIQAAYAALGAGQVAVRSSATAEDLPDLSFAGQQDTYLNIAGQEQLLAAVVNCWSSLWTARAIGYRLRNHISQVEAALAVVVQPMVASDVSGVLFTANPLSGLLSETVIDATFGLGEALVSGQVDPDHFVVDTPTGQITSRALGAKQVATRGKPGGGVETLTENAGARQTLSDDQIRQLVAIGQRIQQDREFGGAPQDIEWAFAGGQLSILQARAITSLFPVPRVSFDPLLVWLSFGSVQGLVGPMTPLGRDAVRYFVAGAGRLFGVSLRPDQADVFSSAGERVWIKVSGVLRHPLGRGVAITFLGIVEPSVRQILVALMADPRLGAGQGRLKLSTVWRLARFFVPVGVGVLGSLLWPERARANFDADIDDYLRRSTISPVPDPYAQLANAITFLLGPAAHALPHLLPRFGSLILPAMAASSLLNRLAADKGLALAVTRALPDNVTTQMDLALWDTASAIHADPAALAAFAQLDAAALARAYLDGALPPAAQAAVARFMERYGMRGLGEIDFGQPRWREDPTSTMHTLQSYLQIDPTLAPAAVFARGQQAARDAVESLAAQARRQRGGWLRARLVRGAARRIRVLMGARETPKFLLIREFGLARAALLDAGRMFVAVGTIDQPDDLVYLTVAELQDLAAQRPHDWKPLIAERRTAFQRELGRRQVPRVLASDGRAFYEGVGALTDTDQVLTGSPVSAGLVEGAVHVVLDPHTARLAPGEILVCPGTDPAWTPLFLVAGGLITEVGGMMTHGSVVAREYGIPAVVGVDRATQRLHTGQRVRLDGTTGQIVLLPS